MGQEFCGIHGTIYNAIMKCDIFLRRSMLANIIISGGNTMFPGLANRVQKEIVPLAPPAVEVKYMLELLQHGLVALFLLTFPNISG